MAAASLAPHFKDLFSGQAQDYARFRPRYPAQLFEYLATLCPAHDLAWDCGTGSGQAAVELARLFRQVVATDPSPKQISQATPASNIEYRVGTAEVSGLEDQCADLVTAAQALHWFRHEDFFRETARVLKPGGILAVWSYNLAKISSEVDAVVLELYEPILGAYWEKERKLVEEGYRSIRLPFPRLVPPPIQMRADWSLENLAGYLQTWSALQTFIKKHGKNPLESLYSRLCDAWGKSATREVRWELSLRVARKPD